GGNAVARRRRSEDGAAVGERDGPRRRGGVRQGALDGRRERHALPGDGRVVVQGEGDGGGVVANRLRQQAGRAAVIAVAGVVGEDGVVAEGESRRSERPDPVSQRGSAEQGSAVPERDGAGRREAGDGRGEEERLAGEGSRVGGSQRDGDSGGVDDLEERG